MTWLVSIALRCRHPFLSDFQSELTNNVGPLILHQGRGRVGSPGRLLSFQGYHHLFIHFRLQWRPLFQHCRSVPELPFSAWHAAFCCCSGWCSGLYVFSSPFHCRYSPVNYRSHLPCQPGLLLCVFQEVCSLLHRPKVTFHGFAASLMLWC